MLEFPMMLYRVIEDGKPLNFDDPKDSLTVSNVSQLEKALDEGWLCHPGTKEHEIEVKQVRAQIHVIKHAKDQQPSGVIDKIKRRIRA